MSNIKLPIQDKDKLIQDTSHSNTDISSISYGNRENNTKMALPISDIKGFSLPLRDIIIRASDDFALRIFENQGGFRSIAFAGSGSMTSTVDLIEVSPISPNSKIFTDIFPRSNIYNGSISRMWQNIEEFYDFLKENKFYFGFLIFLYNELLTNLAYQSSLLAMSVVSLVEGSPAFTDKLIKKYNRLIKILTSSQLRGMWWLNVSTDIKLLIKKLVKITRIVWNIVSKFYLVSVLVVCVGFLQNAAPKLTQVAASNLSVGQTISRQSVLEQYLLQNSIPNPEKGDSNFSNAGYSLLMTPKEEIDESTIPQSCIIKYSIKNGDTLEQLAALYNVSIETIANNNDISPSGLKTGDSILIPCTDAIIYTIKSGDTIENVAQRYKLDTITISSLNSEYLAANGFKESNQILIPGISFDDFNSINNDLAQKDAKTAAESKQLRAQELAKTKEIQEKKKLIDDAKSRAKDNNVDLEKSTCGLIWPTTTKNISQYPSKVHMAIDISNRSLPDIFAAANGKVVYAGWDDSGYGNMVLIDHGDGMKTRYAHNTQLYVSVGDYVTQGQSIAQMGSTGRSSGPHLHYEVIQNGKLSNPLSCY